MKKATCPMCRHAPTPDYAPFCSRRCANLDLQKWLTGSYVLPDNPEEEGQIGGEDDES